MKKLLISIAMSLPLVTVAQVEKGQSILTGSLGYNASGEKDPDQSAPTTVTRQYSLSASYGYMIADRWAIGVGPTYQGNSQAVTGSKNYFRSLSISPFIRRYFSVSEKFYLYLDGGISSTTTQSWNVLDGEKSPVSKSKSFNYFINPGATYFITDRVALQASIGGLSYGTSKSDTSERKSWNFGASFGFSSLILGATWYF